MARTTTRALVVDDDRYYANYVSNLLTDGCGFETMQAHSADAAIELVDRTKFHLVVMDLKMPPGRQFDDVDTAGGHTTGFALARALKRRVPGLKIIVHTAAAGADPALREFTDPDITVLHKSRNPDDLLRAVRRVAGRRATLKAFIVHGHDLDLVRQLVSFLQDDLNFAEPILLSQVPSHGRTLIENFEFHASKVDCAFVVMTPDDVGHAAQQPDAMRSRARQNVIFELGYFYCLMRRQSGRVVVLYKGALEIPSDLSGIVYIDVSNGLASVADRIRLELGPLIDA